MVGRVDGVDAELEKSGFWGGLGTSLPLILRYFPIAFSFGVAATLAALSIPYYLYMEKRKWITSASARQA